MRTAVSALTSGLLASVSLILAVDLALIMFFALFEIAVTLFQRGQRELSTLFWLALVLAVVVVAAFGGLPREFSISIFHHQFPLMIFYYAGSLKSLALWPILHGSSVDNASYGVFECAARPTSIAPRSIASIFLDADLRIKNFTPAAGSVFRLIPADIGRPITDLAPRFPEAGLVDDIREVLKSLNSKYKLPGATPAGSGTA